MIPLPIAAALLVWVTVANPHGIRAGPHYFGVGQRCQLLSTRDVTTHVSPGGRVGYRIEAVRGVVPNTVCPPGTIFHVPQETFARWQQEPMP